MGGAGEAPHAPTQFELGELTDMADVVHPANATAVANTIQRFIERSPHRNSGVDTSTLELRRQSIRQ